MSTEALERACGEAGGQSPLAQKIGVRQSTLWHWLKRSKRGAPGEYVILIEAATGVSRHELRPDLYPLPEGAGCLGDAR